MGDYARGSFWRDSDPLKCLERSNFMNQQVNILGMSDEVLRQTGVSGEDNR
ncbi:hypothetical protein GGE21_003134, partial [Bradyrhizobium centrosematis]|nr:hypothetical protein [Bradyrhizobium centrosematis]